MSSLVVEGGKTLNGTVRSSGAKNAALPILAAVILVPGDYVLENVPYLADVITMVRMLNALGVRAEFHNPNRVLISNTKKVRHIAPYDLVKSMRASFFVAGPILAKTGFAKVPLPGGCSIGSRPVDIHLKGFKSLGAEVHIEHGFVELKASHLVGTEMVLDFPSVGATENIMMAATMATGVTVIRNAAQEPEITDLANFLNHCGARVTGMDTSTIRIEGGTQFRASEPYSVMSDRIETGTLLIAGAITRGDVTVEGVHMTSSKPLFDKMTECGCQIDIVAPDAVRVTVPNKIIAVDIETQPFPGFPTDMQAQFMALLTTAEGKSVIKESIFENRFMHALELTRMGAKIELRQNVATIDGGGASGVVWGGR